MRPLPDAFTVKVKGVSFRDGLSRVALGDGSMTGPERYAVTLIREPDNPHDPCAVAVHAPGVGHVGYVPKALAARLAPELDAGVRWVVAGEVLVHPERRDNPGMLLHLHRV